jgi:hypothetical protein
VEWKNVLETCLDGKGEKPSLVFIRVLLSG